MQEVKQQLHDAPTHTATARLPRPSSTAAQQPQRLREAAARLEADLAASKARIEQVRP